MSVTLSVITGGIYTIISESKFTQPFSTIILASLRIKCYNRYYNPNLIIPVYQ